jgi:hypothetical protein
VGGVTLKLLLDTHIWLWSLLEPEKLSRSIARALRPTARLLDLTLVTADERLLGSREFAVLPTR